MKNLFMMSLLCLAVVIPQASGAATNLGPLRPETPVRGLHPNSWRGRLAVVEAEIKHLAKLYKDQFNKLQSSNRECLRAKVALMQSNVHLAWAKGSGLEAGERLLNDDLRATMKALCGGGGGGSNPAIELYSTYVEEHGPRILGDLVDYLEDSSKVVQVVSSRPVQGSSSFRWSALKMIAQASWATSSTAYVYRASKGDRQRLLASDETLLMGAGLMFVAATGGTGLILIF